MAAACMGIQAVAGSGTQAKGEIMEKIFVRAEIERKKQEIERLKALINTPEINDFTRGVQLEAAHQRDLWGDDHDESKKDLDWYWTLGYLGQKVISAMQAGDVEKAMHHTITTAALMANLHRILSERRRDEAG